MKEHVVRWKKIKRFKINRKGIKIKKGCPDSIL